jgi:hypothetical protein
MTNPYIKMCHKCGIRMLYVPGIGPYCPNKNCDNLDGPSNDLYDDVEDYDIEFVCGKRGGPDKCTVPMSFNPFYTIGFNGRGTSCECAKQHCKYLRAVIE